MNLVFAVDTWNILQSRSGGRKDRRTTMGCKRRVGWSRGVNYFQNKLLSVWALFFHFLICFGSCFPGILPAWSHSPGPLMKYSPWLWGDMREVTWKVKRTKYGRRLGDGKFSHQTQLFKGWVHLKPRNCCTKAPGGGWPAQLDGVACLLQGVFQLIKLNISCLTKKKVDFFLHSNIPAARADLRDVLPRSPNEKMCFIYLVLFYYQRDKSMCN